jgi:hypothetical protein
MHDRADDLDARGVRDRLMARLLADWDPVAIDARMRARRADKDLIGRWARHVRPPDTHRWDLNPEFNRLDRPEP